MRIAAAALLAVILAAEAPAASPASHTYTIVVDKTGSLSVRQAPSGSAVDGPMLAVARSTVTLLTERDLARLHRCANERCVLLFYDTTKSGTRRWCSTACMNRARSISRYQTRKNEALPRQGTK